LDQEGNLYVIDNGNQRILKFYVDSEWTCSFDEQFSFFFLWKYKLNYHFFVKIA
jgi:hypothetical protein